MPQHARKKATCNDCGKTMAAYLLRHRQTRCVTCRYQRQRAQFRQRQQRYQQSAKGCAVCHQYWSSPKGLAAHARNNPRQLRIGRRYVGMADTPELKQQIDRHIKGRLNEFVARQSARKKAEGF